MGLVAAALDADAARPLAGQRAACCRSCGWSMAIGVALVVLRRRILAAAHPRVQRGVALVLRRLAPRSPMTRPFARAAPHRPAAGGHALHRRRLRQHPRAAAAAAHPAAQPVARGGGHAADVLSARELGGAARLRPPRGPVASAAAPDGRAGAVASRCCRSIGLAPTSGVMLAAVLRRRARRRGLPSAGGGAGPPSRRAQRGLAMSFHITGGTLGFCDGAAGLRAVRASGSACVDAAADDPGAGRPALLPAAPHARARAAAGQHDAGRASARCGRTRSR